MSRRGRKLQVAPPVALSADEQALLAAYRAMAGNARDWTLRQARHFANVYPVPVTRQPLHLIAGGRL